MVDGRLEATPRSRSNSWAAFGLWAIVGAAAAFALLALPTLGVLLVLLVGLLVVARPSVRASMDGALAGAGAISLFVAYVQRRGPGTVCWHTATASGCDQYLNPWPWLIAGVALVAMSLVLEVRSSRPR